MFWNMYRYWTLNSPINSSILLTETLPGRLRCWIGLGRKSPPSKTSRWERVLLKREILEENLAGPANVHVSSFCLVYFLYNQSIQESFHHEIGAWVFNVKVFLPDKLMKTVNFRSPIPGAIPLICNGHPACFVTGLLFISYSKAVYFSINTNRERSS